MFLMAIRKSIAGIRLSLTCALVLRTSVVISQKPRVYIAIEPNITSTTLGNQRNKALGYCCSTQTRIPHKPQITAINAKPVVIILAPLQPAHESCLQARIIILDQNWSCLQHDAEAPSRVLPYITH